MVADLGPFAELGLVAELTRAIADQGYTQPTPIQTQAIPVVLAGRDVLAGAQTGTGKTAGFTLPLLQRLTTIPPETLSQKVRALIVTPTRELAMQIEESVRAYGKYLPLRSTVVFGGVGMAPQVEALKEGVEILVATPGRLLDHAHEQTVDLSHVEILVLDEADRMLDMGFIHDVKRILALLPAHRQNLLFSATFSDDIRELASGLLHDPAMIEVARRNAESELVAQRVYPVGQDRKRALLAHLVKTGDWKQVLVFTRTKHGANRLAHQLGRSGISATAIHGNKGQGARTKALADFKVGAVRVLVATDLAARGLDIEELPHVVNFDLPHVAEDYVHRIGRTGRAGSTGEAVSLVSPEETPLLTEIEKLLKRTVEQTVIPGFEPGSGPGPAQQQARPPQSQPAPEGERQGGQDTGEGGRRGRRRRGRGRTRGEGQPQTDNVVAANDGAQPVARQEAQQRQQGNQGNQGNQHQQRRDQSRDQNREDRDNRGNRDTRPRNARPIVDDDFGNRFPQVKNARSVRARIAAGDIDEELDAIGNRIPSVKAQRLAGFGADGEEINFNVAPIVAPMDGEGDDDHQPQSNAGQLFPSSAGFMGDERPRRGRRGRGGQQAQGGRVKANGNGNGAGRGAGNPAGGNGNGNGNGQGRKRRRRGQQRQGQVQGQGQNPNNARGQGKNGGSGNGNAGGNGQRQQQRRRHGQRNERGGNAQPQQRDQ